MKIVIILLLGAIAVSALPTELPKDPFIDKVTEDRYQYVVDGEDQIHYVDLWASEDESTPRYDPDRQNVYHLFTRNNPQVSQPMLIGNEGLLGLTDYDPLRRTIVILHGWRSTATSDVNAVLVPAFLSAENVNVIVVDWSAGGGNLNYLTAVSNTVTSGESVARFINWLNSVTGTSAAHYHLVGHSLGAHQAGVIGRNINGNIAYITGLDPSYSGWVLNSNKLKPEDSSYTEVIHTNAGLIGYIGTLGHADFYPNGGISMPGCDSQSCDHSRSYFYFSESLLSGGFTGRRCATYVTAMTGQCFLWGNLHMGGLVPKTGSSGIYYLETNGAPPFSKD
ncbi:pancreatic triacylglycerol lipase-like [Plodia interpunctella]|uniref:pancreatic triacylglycerol lipase-like n=1 Tax=Plodia interpunctella TaxID=58824 RepID=UPI0023679FF5|nr:pancreatic triacylglycerol lipase-like [Plodia interpunctella]